LFLFSGCAIDTADRANPKFPSNKSDIATEKITEVLAALDASEDDLALTQGAAGGDILFDESLRTLQSLATLHSPNLWYR
jgi:hypothetical protein